MKKLLFTVALLALLACAFCAGRLEGVRHAIEDSEIFTVTCYNPDAPEESAAHYQRAGRARGQILRLRYRN